MSYVVFLLEEYSMKVFLEALLPRLFPALPFKCIPHQGKQDLEKSIPRKLKAWREPGVRFIVLRDNDSGDCRELKKKLATLCRDAGRPEALVRIACQELEAWYLGDSDALAEGFGNERLRVLTAKERFRDPDAVVQPSRALLELVPEFQKVSGARLMAPRLTPEKNRSQSFRTLLDAIERAEAALR
jgi:Domain of unknown function (DUF4276)